MIVSQQQRGEEMDAMLTEKDRKLAEKEAYIVHLQSALAGDQPVTPAPQHQVCPQHHHHHHRFSVPNFLEREYKQMNRI